jgi:hypothetical protein
VNLADLVATPHGRRALAAMVAPALIMLALWAGVALAGNSAARAVAPGGYAPRGGHSTTTQPAATTTQNRSTLTQKSPR